MADWADKIIVLTALFLSIAAIMNTLIVSQLSLQISDLTGRVSDLQANVNRLRELPLPPVKMPDLMVTDIVFSPSSPNAGNNVQITTHVKNQGNAIAGSYKVRVRDMTLGTVIGESMVNSTIQNQTITTTVTYQNISEGNHTITSTADWYNEIGESNENNNDRTEILSVSPPPPAPPSAPSNLTATAVSSSQINLQWRDNSNNEQGFKIERCQVAGCSNFAQIATVGANVVSYSNTGLTASTSYSYRVRAYNSGGDSQYSNTASATTFGGGNQSNSTG